MKFVRSTELNSGSYQDIASAQEEFFVRKCQVEKIILQFLNTMNCFFFRFKSHESRENQQEQENR
jgi:hypothetical protein